MQNRPMLRRKGQVRDRRPGANTTSGGSSDRELNDWQVNPMGPSSVSAVTTVTPDAKCPSTSRISRGSTIRGAPSDTGGAGHGPAAGAVQGARQLVPDGVLGDPGGGQDRVEV